MYIITTNITYNYLFFADEISRAIFSTDRPNIYIYIYIYTYIHISILVKVAIVEYRKLNLESFYVMLISSIDTQTMRLLSNLYL